MPKIPFLMAVILEARKKLAKNILLKSSQLVMDLGTR